MNHFGMTQEQFTLLERLVINPLKSCGAVVYIFGSRVAKNNHHFSDVDILYSSNVRIPSAVISKIKEDIEESRFPFAVDIVAESDLAEGYRESVQQSRVRI